MKYRFLLFISFFLSTFCIIYGRKHHLILTNDSRRHVSLSTFGFFVGGQLDVHVRHFSFSPYTSDSLFGFMLTRAYSDAVTPFVESQQDKCLLEEPLLYNDASINLIAFSLDFHQNIVKVNCSSWFNGLKIIPDANFSMEFSPRERRNIGDQISDSFLMPRRKRYLIQDSQSPPNEAQKSQPIKEGESAPDAKAPPKQNQPDAPTIPPTEVANNPLMTALPSTEKSCPFLTFPLHKSKDGSYNLRFHIKIDYSKVEGLYSLYFHNCANLGQMQKATYVNLTVDMIEVNGDNFLSAGEIPLPRLYFMMSLVFFTASVVWIYILRKKKNETFKIHYLMGLLVVLKSASLMFHGINYYFIAKDGYPMEAWAVLYYITHLLKGALLFITIVLVGTGWAFIKHILSDQDKKIFMIVLPLQVLANVAKIIMEESEEGDSKYSLWREVFIFVDLICCGAILFPVVWSIRHLQEASQTDGKAAINLEKLKLFRHFYIMVVCYIYFTRIIVFLLKITVPFQYEWLDEAFRELATLAFFILTGYNFRPTTANPYFRLPSDDDELEMEQVVTQSGLMENISKTMRSREDAANMSKRESSHEYD